MSGSVMEYDPAKRDMKSRRLCIVGPAYPYRGGIAHFTEMTARTLQAQGHHVDLVSFSRQYPERLFPGETQLAEGEVPSDDLPIAHRLIDTVNPLSWWKAAGWIKEQSPDAVVFQYWMPFFAPAYGTMAWRLDRRSVRTLAVVHNALPHERHTGDAALSRLFLRRLEGAVVMSEAVEADVQRLAPQIHMRPVPHPIYRRFGDSVSRDVAREQLGLPADGSVVLFFGFVRAYKGLHVLLDALPAAGETIPDLHLVIAGEAYEDADRYREKIQRHGLSQHVTWHERYIPSDEVPLYFSAADVVAQPYVSATQSGVAQIALHFETPLIVTDVGGLAEIIPHEEAGFVVPPERPDALAEALVRFFSGDWVDRLAAGMRRVRERHAPARLAEAIGDLL